MKKTITFIGVILLFGCRTTPNIPGFTIKSLDGNILSREIGEKDGPYREIEKQYEIGVAKDGTPIINSETLDAIKKGKIQSVKFTIDSQVELRFIPRVTKDFTDFQRLEFWTQYGIFIVGAPSYGWRRLPIFGKNTKHVDIKVDVSDSSYQIQVGENYKNIESPNMDDCIEQIFNEFGFPVTSGFKNVYFIFPEKTKWADVELLMAMMFNRIDSLRGFWIGPGKEKGKVIIDFHDIYQYK